MKIAAIIQARMGSARLPGKVLRRVLNKPLLEYQLERIYNASLLDDVIVATTNKTIDNDIVAFCKKHDITVYRGSESDVLKRYVEAANRVQADGIVRLTADCPLLDPELIDHMIETFKNLQPIDYVSNVIERTFPRGLDIEVFTMEALERVDQLATADHHREHVTRYFLDHPGQFHIQNVVNDKDISNYRWTVDTIEDFYLIEKIITSLYPGNSHFQMDDVVSLLEENPEWEKINATIEQKGG